MAMQTPLRKGIVEIKNSIILKKTYLAYLIKYLKDKRLEQDNRKAAKVVWVHYCQENFEILNH